MNHVSINTPTDTRAVSRPLVPRPPQKRIVTRTSSVGRIGKLHLEYVRRGSRTVFGRTYCQTPWHLLPPIYLDETGSAYTLLVNPSGGLVGGDHLSIDCRVRPKAHVIVSTPSANRVYRSPAKDSVQDIKIDIEAGGILEWLPEHTIPYAASRFRQTIDVKLASGATVLLWDAIASGRIARGERWKFTSLENAIRIGLPSGLSIQEHYHLMPGETLGGPGLAEAWDYVGSLFVIGDQIEASVWKGLETALASILDQRGDRVLGGVSQSAVPGLVVKMVAKSAPDMTAMLYALWKAVRKTLWQFPPLALRKY